MIFVILFLILCGICNGAPNVCRLPPRWKTNYDFDYSKQQHEWATPNSKTDYYMLVLSWSPSFCKHLPSTKRNHTFQCQYDDFGLVVHGLWAQSRRARTLRQHPRNCRNSEALPLTTIKRHFCMMPDESLIQAEWEKHGTCGFRTAEEYLNTIEKLFTALKIPDMQQLLRDKRMDQYKLKKAFIEKNPSLRSNNMIIYMKGTDLIDIKICYDLKLKYTNCQRK
ncbi:unnamed protein product [Rotaria sp. Silwood1]|nr:unnamed protein product [Rotaria sp. Silwood1]CAF1146446.1 unnamed protein product [Rotaria sp. Silwood1]CAF3444645.1 unnamed protein product [Rotaria sp. Silwood1]CAF3452147.1 unnamed protein product [Rotaria sp. Silwood1]CAF3468835.1 unnamed protein product [Rotaria sp. Silwood1]